MIRLSAEKESRAVLTTAQADRLDILLTESEDASTRTRPIWESQVAPLPLNAIPFAAPDSGSVRIAVAPLTTEVFFDDRSVGFGRVQLRAAIGTHTLKFRSPGCTETLQVTVSKGPQAVIAHRISCAK